LLSGALVYGDPEHAVNLGDGSVLHVRHEVAVNVPRALGKSQFYQFGRTSALTTPQPIQIM